MVCEFHDSNGNSFGDIWWTDKLIHFSSIDESPLLLSCLIVAEILASEQVRWRRVSEV